MPSALVRTARLDLRALDPVTTRAALAGDRVTLSTALGVELPAGWPTTDLLPLLELHGRRLADDPRVPGWGPWAVLDRAAGTLVGDVGFTGVPDGQGQVELGFAIVEPFRRRGFATEAARAVVGWAAAHASVAAVLAECAVDNDGSIGVLTRLGFKVISRTPETLRWRADVALFGGG